MTLFDRLYGMRQEYDFIMSERGDCWSPSESEVANLYDGGRHLIHTESVHKLSQTAYTRIGLDWAFINVLGDIKN